MVVEEQIDIEPAALPGGPIPDSLYAPFGEYWATAKRIVETCENPGLRPDAISATGDYGIMQINAATWANYMTEKGYDFWNQWMIPEVNVAMGAEIFWNNGGFGHWTCY